MTGGLTGVGADIWPESVPSVVGDPVPAQCTHATTPAGSAAAAPPLFAGSHQRLHTELLRQRCDEKASGATAAALGMSPVPLFQLSTPVLAPGRGRGKARYHRPTACLPFRIIVQTFQLSMFLHRSWEIVLLILRALNVVINSYTTFDNISYTIQH